MNKTELINAVANSLETSKVNAKLYVDTVFDQILNTLSNGEDVSISGFGMFKVKERNARTARNPKTGETVQVPQSYAVTFKPASTLKDAVKNLDI